MTISEALRKRIDKQIRAAIVLKKTYHVPATSQNYGTWFKASRSASLADGRDSRGK